MRQHVPIEHKKVLVLNKQWAAVGIVTLKRAIVMLWSDSETPDPEARGKFLPKARVIDHNDPALAKLTWKEWMEMKPADGEDRIVAAHDLFRVPEVVVLTDYDKIPSHTARFNRRTIYRRDRYRCAYCGYHPPRFKKDSQDEYAELSQDHIIPKSRGGKTTWENIVTACTECNCMKADKLPEEVRNKKFPHGMPRPKPTRPPAFNLFKGEYRCKSWRSFMDSVYWNIPLENDMNEDEE